MPALPSTQRRQSPQKNAAATGVVASEAYIRRHHLDLYLNDLVSMQAGISKGADSLAAAVGYLDGVLNGQHVVGRSFEWIAKTPHNRSCFLLQAREAFRGLEMAESESRLLTADDYLCVFRMLSSDFPSRVVKSAFKASSQLPSGADSEQAGLSVPAFFQALNVVFLHETYLLTLRQLAFGGRSQSGRSVQDVLLHIGPAQLACKEAGWCPLPADAVEAACKEAASSGGNLAFDSMVRSLCGLHKGIVALT